MRMLRIAVLGVATVAFAAVLAGGAGADEPKPDAGMAGKVTASAGFDKQHGPHSQFECISHERRREHEPRLRRPVPEQRAGHRGRPGRRRAT